MKRSLGIFNSDQVNRSGFRFPASTLIEAEERHQLERRGTNLPPGLPVNIQHDMHRPVGWSQVLGHMIDGSMVRVVGMVHEAETDHEKTQLAALVSALWEQHHDKGMDSYKRELAERVKPMMLDETSRYLQIESYAVSQKGLAAQLYPELFAENSERVDKDGLVDYRTLCKRLKQVQPGVFHDDKRDLLIFAHRFFRRSLSHRNKLNEYFLLSFDKTSEVRENLIPRLRLDPDLIGHPSTIHNLVELEYWRGPRFTDDISSIANGVSEHKATPRTMYYEGIDKTHIWWKSPESRQEADGTVEYRTFEVEELIENASGGLPDDHYGCRYAHAEYSANVSAITHFDGAIRAYPADAYFKRIDVSIDRAGKHSDYTKLFRFDGPLAVQEWKRLLSDYFRGNPLIPEYLAGEKSEIHEVEESTNEEDGQTSAVIQANRVGPCADLSAFVSLSPGKLAEAFTIEQGFVSLPNDGTTPTIETGCAEVDKLLRGKIDLSGVTSLGSTDGTLNLSKLSFGASASADFPALMHQLVVELANALEHDVNHNGLQKAAVALRWEHGDLLTTLSLRGQAKLVAQTLDDLFSVVDVTKPASEWIERLAERIKRLAPLSSPNRDLTGVTNGVLSIERPDEASYRMIFPDALMHALLGSSTHPR
jgi:hypothetical protein